MELAIYLRTKAQITIFPYLPPFYKILKTQKRREISGSHVFLFALYNKFHIAFVCRIEYDENGSKRSDD